MEKTFKYRIYPNKNQQKLIQKTFGCTRFVYNYYLDARIKKYKESKKILTYCQNCKDLTKLKKEFVWLQEVDVTALQSSLKKFRYGISKIL